MKHTHTKEKTSEKKNGSNIIRPETRKAAVSEGSPGQRTGSDRAVSSAPDPAAARSGEFLIPEKYGDNKVVLMARDPYWCYAFWDISGRLLEEKKKTIDPAWGNMRLCLRMHDVTGIDFAGGNSNKSQDIYIYDPVGNWYINIWSPARSYLAEAGIKTDDGHFIVLARSNVAAAPPDSVSEDVSEEWSDSKDNFNEIFKMSGGEKLGGSENSPGSAMYHEKFKNNGF
jgi:hypothetical protein